MTAALQQSLARVRSQPGILACALVDVVTGMVVHWDGPPDLQPVAEAASDYWRLCGRLEPVFDVLGRPLAQVIIHEHRRITIVRCGRDLVLVTLTRESESVDWVKWKQSTADLQHLALSL